MTVVRIKGLKRYKSKGRWFVYHRKTGIRLREEFGTGAFMAELEAITPSVQAQAVYAEPVRVQNPFDKREVFEFPAGTSEQEARDAMADMLLKRAIDRQAAYDAKHPRRKSAH